MEKKITTQEKIYENKSKLNSIIVSSFFAGALVVLTATFGIKCVKSIYKNEDIEKILAYGIACSTCAISLFAERENILRSKEALYQI